MLTLKRPPRLRRGDTVALLSLSSGMAGDDAFRFRYEIGKQRLAEVFGLQVREYPTTLAGSEKVYRHPELRAQDLMAAFEDPEIRAIFTCIGGEESMRLFPFLDLERIARHPKLLLGYSDTTFSHLVCLKAGFGTVYGPSLLAEFAENQEIFPYTRHWMEQVLFCPVPAGEIPPADAFTRAYLPWTPENQHIGKALQPDPGPILLQGGGTAEGPLIGGCLDVLDFLRGTPVFPPLSAFQGSLVFLETSEESPSGEMVARWLRSLAAMGILKAAAGILFGKPYRADLEEEHRQAVQKILEEEHLLDTPVLFGLNFGHTEPMCCLPYGVRARLDCRRRTITLLESAVL